MIVAGPGNGGFVIERAHYVWCLATLAIEELAFCAWRLPAGPPFCWNVDDVIPVLQFFSAEK